jgi:hypothetical protein
MVSDHLANAHRVDDRLVKWSVLSPPATKCRVVFFQLYIGRTFVGRPNSYTALNNLGPQAI